jgi:hypothetical protein
MTFIFGRRASEGRRAVNPGDERSLMVTRGHTESQVRPHNRADRTDSQADCAGSIPVTRSTRESPAQTRFRVYIFRSACVTGLVWREVKAPTVTGHACPNCAEAIKAEGAVGSSALAVELVTFVRWTNPKKAAAPVAHRG